MSSRANSRPATALVGIGLVAFSLATTTAIVPAQAQGLSSAELWNSWQEEVAAAGGLLTAGTELREGNTLVLGDISLQTGAVGENAPALHLEQMKLVNRADGSVGIALPERFPLRVQSASGDDGTELRFMVAAPALDLAVHGIGSRSSFAAKAPSISVTLDGIVPPPSLAQDDTVIMLGLADLNLRYALDLTGPNITIEGEASFGTLHGELRFHEDADSNGSIVLDLAGGTARLGAALPQAAMALMTNAPDAEPGVEQLLKVLEAGTFFDTAVELGQTGLQLDIADAENPVAMTVSVAGIKGASRLDRAAIGYDYAVEGLDFSVPAALVELPAELGEVGIALEQFAQTLFVGLNDLKGPQDWRYKLLLSKLDLSPAIWDQLDAKRLLPRDPVTLSLDLAGIYGIAPESLAPGWTATPGSMEPLNALSFQLDSFAIEGLGVGFGGQGGLRFNFADLTRYEGIPAPEGTLTFTASGVYALMDRLVEAGFLPADEVTALRAGLMFVAKAGTEPDTLLSQLMFDSSGFFLNGMKLR